jgi:hypothetical protein
MDNSPVYSNEVSIVASTADLTIRFRHQIPTVAPDGTVSVALQTEQIVVMSLDQARLFLSALQQNFENHDKKMKAGSSK